MYKIPNHIVITNGKATMAGHGGIKAELVARMVVNDGYTIEQTMEQYNLSRAQVLSAMAFYYENQEYLDAEHKRKWDLIHAEAMTLEQFKEKLAKKKQQAITEE
ncbi:MAG TPA: hypothetical protein PLZ51_01900 [Aggregatilineales bacterium]|nr:hypothetical protein [Aggregatilineales bacterium]